MKIGLTELSLLSPSPQLVQRLSAGAPAWGRRITKSLSPEEVLSTRFLSPSSVACPACPERSRGERSRRAPAWGRRIAKFLSPEGVLSTRFLSPSPVACPACPERSRGERSRRAPATGRIFRVSSLEEGPAYRRQAEFTPPVAGHPLFGPSSLGRKVCPAPWPPPRGIRRGLSLGRRITKSLSPEEVLSTRFFLRVD